MTANELRIGNFINQGEQYGEQPINAYQLYQYSLGGFISSNNIPTYYHYWRPIPLTEEWLVKLGLKQIRDTKCFQTKEGYNIDNTNGKGFRFWLWEFDGCGEYNTIAYVHTLQNLYFALTGEELKLKN